MVSVKQWKNTLERLAKIEHQFKEQLVKTKLYRLKVVGLGQRISELEAKQARIASKLSLVLTRAEVDDGEG